MPIISAEEIAKQLNGHWTCLPTRPIAAVRESLRLIEEGLEDFLYVPEFFFSQPSRKRDAAILSCVDAFDVGASACLVSRVPCNVSSSQPMLVVDDVGKAVVRFAHACRANSAAKFVLVCGSRGKSTTKNCTAALLAQHGETVKSVFNYNTGTSIELMLANLTPSTRFCALEVAIRNIAKQAELIAPDVVVLTNVAKEHVVDQERAGFFGDDAVDNIIQKKCQPFRYLSHNGTAILNRDDAHFPKMLAHARSHQAPYVLTFGASSESDVRLLDSVSSDVGNVVTVSIAGQAFEYQLSLTGTHNVYNSVAGVAAIHALGLDIGTALPALACLTPDVRRGERHSVPCQGGTFELINETTNSTGRAAILRTLATEPLKPGCKRIAVLGSVPDLGSIMPQEMQRLADEANELPIHRFFTIGEEMAVFNRVFPDRSKIAPHSQGLGELEEALLKEVSAGDIVAVKSSRRPKKIALRRLCKSLVERRHHTARGRSTETEPQECEVSILFCGDTYLGESYQNRKIANAGANSTTFASTDTTTALNRRQTCFRALIASSSTWNAH